MEFARKNAITTSFRETYSRVRLLLKTTLLSILVAVSGMAFAERDTSRDQYRHPMETLAFFGITPQMDVLEISPGGGWYTELLADYVTGNLLAGHYDPQSKRAYYRNSQSKFAAKIAASPELYGNVQMHIFDAAAKKLSAEDSSVDAVVTFRNVHNWMGSNTEASSFELFFDALKPDGMLGVVEHRAPAGTDKATMQKKWLYDARLCHRACSRCWIYFRGILRGKCQQKRYCKSS
jgi:predicted methyltransferase